MQHMSSPALPKRAFALFFTFLFTAVCAYSSGAHAQGKDKPPPATGVTACPSTAELKDQQLYGEWRVTWQDTGKTIPLHFVANPEYPDSLTAELREGNTHLQLAGDLEDGQLVLEESPDGKKISATWVGQVEEGSCGKTIRGTWTQDESMLTQGGQPLTRRFTLRRVVRW